MPTGVLYTKVNGVVVPVMPAVGTPGATGPAGPTGATGPVGATGPSGSGGGSAMSYVIKSGDTTRTSSTTINEDPHLQMPLTAGTWLFEQHIAYQAHPDGKIRGTLFYSGTQTSNFRVFYAGPGSSTSDLSNATLISRSSNANGYWLGGGDNGNQGYLIARMWWTLTGAGTLSVAWAQLTSNATGTTVFAGSMLTAQKLA